MLNLSVPTLLSPIASAVNQYSIDLEYSSIDWIRKFDLIKREVGYRKFIKAKFFLFTSMIYPTCPLEELTIINDFVSWFFMWDDQCDISNLTNQPELLKFYQDRFIEILNGAELTSSDIPLGYALQDIRKRMLKIGSSQCFTYFVRSLEEYFQGCVQEATNRKQNIILDVDTYIKLRSSTGGANIFLNFIEFCHHLVLPDYVRENHKLKQLNLMTNHIACWDNDIFSVHREKKNNDVHNLVLVLQNQQEISLEEAINMTVEMRNQELENLMLLAASLPSFGELVDSQLAKYISGLYSCIQGSLDWHSSTVHYQTKEILTTIA